MPPILFWRDVKQERRSRFQFGGDCRSVKQKQQKQVVLIPFISAGEHRPAILICPEWENGRQRMMDEGMKAAEVISKSGCQAFILNTRADNETDDMARAVRFIRANYQKLHVVSDQVVLLTFGEMKTAARKLFFHSKRVKDGTHRYDALKCEPEALWIVGEPDEDAGKMGIHFSGESNLLTESGRQWLVERMKELTENITEESAADEKKNEGEEK